MNAVKYRAFDFLHAKKDGAGDRSPEQRQGAETKMRKADKRSRRLWVFLLMGALVFSGCGREETKADDSVDNMGVIREQKEQKAEGLALEEGMYYLCNDYYERRLLLLDDSGNPQAEFASTEVSYLVQGDGTLSDQIGGQIREGAALVLWDTESGNSGIWRVGQKQWSVPPTEPMISIEEKNGKLVSLTIGTQMYDSKLMPVEEDPGQSRTYALEDGRVFRNRNDGYEDYISEEQEEFWMRPERFYLLNQETGVPEGDSIFAEDVVAGNKLLIRYFYTEQQEDGTWLRTDNSYLCDGDGRIMFSGWRYDAVVYAIAADRDYTDRKYLRFLPEEGSGGAEHFVRVSTMTPVNFPTEYQEASYLGDDRFLLEGTEESVVYHASAGEIELRIPAEENSAVQVCGTGSYIRYGGESRGNMLVLQGKESAAGSDHFYRQDCPGSSYDIIQRQPEEEEIRISYIVGPEPGEVAAVEGKILWADEIGYLRQENGSFFLYDYTGNKLCEWKCQWKDGIL